MNDVEGLVRPTLTRMILGKASLLDEQTQTIVGRWCLKTVIILDAASQPSRVPPLQRELFYRERVPSAEMFIWLTGTKTGRPRFGFLGQALIFPVEVVGESGVTFEPMAIEPGNVNGYALTINVGHFTAQVFGCRSDRYRDRLASDPANRSLVQIWPTTGEGVQWPGGWLEGVDDFDRLGRRFFPGSEVPPFRDFLS
jgi:hypothetical protein